MNQVDKVVLLLSENPGMGAMEETLRDLGIFRYVVVGPAKLIYTIEDGYLFIHLYWDCRQDSGGMISYLDD